MLTLTLRVPLQWPLELDGVTPDKLRTLSAGECLKLPVLSGNRREELGAFFAAGGDASDGAVRFVGDLSRARGIGRAMAGGTIRVEGHAGWHAGAQMTGGELSVAGDAGDWLGAEMRSGAITVSGSAGDSAGAAYPGSRLGMRGGTIRVQGSVEAEAGARMRRGVIVIGGDAGPFLAAGMIAGSVIVGGGAGAHAGAGMKRGTLILGRPAELPASFAYSCRYRPAFLGWLGRECGVSIAAGEFDCWRGDALEGGRGEVLAPAAT